MTSSIPVQDSRRPRPASPVTQRVWLAMQAGSPGALPGPVLRVRVGGALEPERLRAALAAVVRDDEALRCAFAVCSDGTLGREVLPDAAPVLAVADLARLPHAAREAAAARRAEELAAEPTDPAHGPMLRALLAVLGPLDSLLYLVPHSLAADAWCADRTFRRLAVALGASIEASGSALPPPTLCDDARVDAWRDRLAGTHAALELPTARVRPSAPGLRCGEHPVALDPSACTALRGLCAAEDAPAAAGMMAAYAVLLSRCSGQEDVVIGAPLDGVGQPRTEASDPAVVRVHLGGDPRFRELVREVSAALSRSVREGGAPMDRLAESCGAAISRSHHPVFQAGFALRDGRARRIAAPGLLLELEDVRSGPFLLDLSLEMVDRGGAVEGVLRWAADVYDEAFAARMAERLAVLVAGAAAAPDQRVSDLPLLADDERALVLERWNATRADYPRAVCIHQLFQEQAAAHPEAPAVVEAGETLTYAEVDRRAGIVARRLRGMGVGPEARVGICLPRSADLYVAMLGVMKAGGAYVPLDPCYPAERLATMANDAGITALVTRADASPGLPSPRRTTVVMEPGLWSGDSDESDSADASTPPPEVSSESPAYVIYTSGSTGRPKGVAVPHRAVVNLLADAQRRVPLGPGDRCSGWTSVSFDVSVYDVFSALTAGAALVPVPDAIRAMPRELADWLAAERITSAYLPPFALPELATWLKEHPGRSRLRRLLVGVEPIPETLLHAIRERAPGLAVFNGYGPTETTVYSTVFPVEGEAGPERPAPIGFPIANTRTYVLDRHLRPVPAGAAGELCLGGEGVARGYLRRPAQTAERFVPDPFSPEAGGRMYRTGDLARHNPDGSLQFLGRIDRQVKLRGFRIEPGEIEAALTERDEIAEAVVMVREDAPGERRLAAYVVPARWVAAGAGEGPARFAALVSMLRAHLRGRLPEYMLPSAVIALDAFPLTPNGKIDRHALPAPDGVCGEGYVAPRNPAEEAVAEVFAAVLRLPRVGAKDDFFDLGGHSLLATQVVSRVRDALQVEVPLAAVFEAPTVEALAARVDAAQQDVLARLLAELEGLTDDEARALAQSSSHVTPR
jgi:amino acid adenylation domain-containing protein